MALFRTSNANRCVGADVVQVGECHAIVRKTFALSLDDKTM